MFEPPAKGFEVINARPPMHIRCPEGHSRLKPGFLILGISFSCLLSTFLLPFYTLPSEMYIFEVKVAIFDCLEIWKAGTTSLASTLAQHPQVVYPNYSFIESCLLSLLFFLLFSFSVLLLFFDEIVERHQEKRYSTSANIVKDCRPTGTGASSRVPTPPASSSPLRLLLGI